MNEAERLAEQLDREWDNDELSYDTARNAAAELRRLSAINAELVEALDVAKQFMSIASDWNFDEAEINGEMKSTYDWIDLIESALEKAKQ